MFTAVKELNLNEIIKKYVNNKSLYIIIIIGVVFMLFSGGGKKHEDNISTPEQTAYSDEERLESILEKIHGVGEVSVLVTYYGTTTYDVAFEKKQKSTEKEDENVWSEESSVITSGGEPLIQGVVYPKAKGVVIIAQGAGDAEIKKAITDAAVAALEISSYKVCVLEGKERN